tara:strand:- start:519 stop:1037 length:519 start_codon:yes stop_codon:yes gene_type:complete
MSKPMTENENKYFEMPKWSVFIVENYDATGEFVTDGNRAIFEIKKTFVDLDEMEQEWKDGTWFDPCDEKTNESFGGGEWYEWVGFCLSGWETGSVTIEFSDKETEQKYKIISTGGNKKLGLVPEGLDPDEIFEKMGLGIETVLYFRLKRDDERYDWDITEQFSKYLEEASDE